MVVPRWFTKALKCLRVFTRLVVVDEQRGELRLDGFDEQRIGQYIPSELLAACTAWNLLKQGKNGLSARFARDQRRIEITAPGDGACLDGV